MRTDQIDEQNLEDGYKHPIETQLDPMLSGVRWIDKFEIGNGVDAITGEVLQAKAIDDPDLKERPGQTSASSYRLIKTEADVKEEVQLAAAGKYNIEGVNVEASTEYLSQLKQSQTSTTLVARYESQNVYYKEASRYVLTSKAKELMDKDHRAFRAAYGDYFVAGERLGRRYVATFTCTASTVDQMNSFKASLGANVPNVFTAEGSVAFQKAVSQNNVDLRVSVTMQGVTEKDPPNPFPQPQTPEEVKASIDWFARNAKGVALEAKLVHYSALEPLYPRAIAIDPDVFVDLSLLYGTMWTVRARYGTCPTRLQKGFKEEYDKLNTEVTTKGQQLAEDPAFRKQLHDRAKALLKELDAVFDRVDFIGRVRERIRSEPGQGRGANGGTSYLRVYGYSTFPLSSAVSINRTELHYEDSYKAAGNREKSLELSHDEAKLIVGWEVTDNWNSDTNGKWWQESDQIILRKKGSVKVRSQYSRGLNWTVAYYWVPAVDYEF